MEFPDKMQTMQSQKGWFIGRGEKGPAYKEWMEKEGIPSYEDIAGVADLTELPRRPWARMGGLGTFIELEGTMQARELLYVVEIPGGSALEPEKHLYNEVIYIMRGRGSMEVWQEGEGKPKRSFEWGGGSLFAPPLNTWHRLVNGGREPALAFAITSAPLVMNALGDTDFIFNCDHNFTDRYTGDADYFVTKEKHPDEKEQWNSWETNFVPDLRTAFLGDYVGDMKVEGGRVMGIMMADGWASLHTSWWPTGKYHKAHYHGPGAILLGLRSEGYALMWPRAYGVHPFQDGYGDKVLKVPWKENSIYCPPTEWFHAHYNTGKEQARHLAVKGGGIGFDLPSFSGTNYIAPCRVEGGTIIEYEDEDPEIRRLFQEDLQKKGIEFDMNPVVYRTDPIGRIV